MSNVVKFPQGEPDERALTLAFITQFREALGVEPLADTPNTLRDGLAQGVGSLKLYRYKMQGRQFAITNSEEVRDALVAAGASSATTFRPIPGANEQWDLPLPPFLWKFI